MKKFVIEHLTIQSRRLIRKVDPQIIAITGSVGKSSTKDAVAAVLRGHFPLLKSPKNYNTEIGLPCAILGLESKFKSPIGWSLNLLKGFWRSNFPPKRMPRVFVLEMAADHPGDIAHLCDIAPPKIGVVTAIGESHAESYNTVDEIAYEKSVLISRLPNDGIAVLNRDDAAVWQMRDKTSVRIISFGFSDDAQVRASDIKLTFTYAGGDECGVSFSLEYDGQSAPVFLSGTIGRQAVNSALAAAGVGIAKELSLAQIAEGLRDFTPPPGRMRCIAGIKHTLLIDDTYNAAPKSVLAGLAAVASIDFPGEERKIAVLGDMLALGKITNESHEKIGKAVVEHNFDLVVFVGDKMSVAHRAALEAGMAEQKIFHFPSTHEAGLFVQERLKKGDVVFIKGSRGMRMEAITKELMADPLSASSLLVDGNEH